MNGFWIGGPPRRLSADAGEREHRRLLIGFQRLRSAGFARSKRPIRAGQFVKSAPLFADEFREDDAS